MYKTNRLISIVAIQILTTLSYAEPLVTDRPDATESSNTMEPGYFQLELGWTHTEDNDAGDIKTDNFPGTLVR